ncbi:MAG: hypothetical protein BM556_05960 [Bacteriovorax sp. MedPE-SWde]|nr:MAG: hypothetical protein BM556_05960 [Bacteriovorax sp. MedPE-SWde]
MPELTKLNDSKGLLKEQLVSDLNTYFSNYKDYSLAQKYLATNSGVHLKTIQRLCRKENNPGHTTLLKIYKVLLGESDYQKLFSLLPEIIRNTLKEDSIQNLSRDINYSLEIKREILADRVFCEIYFLVDAGNTSIELIQFKFGEHGLDTVKRMIDLKALRYNSEGLLELGSERAEIDPQVIKHSGLTLSEKYSKTKDCEVKGENFIGLYVESLPENIYQEWLQIDKDAFIKKAELAKKHRVAAGGKKVFTYMTTDTFIKEKNENINH